MTDAEAALDRLCDPDAEVSAHYLIGRDGVVWQLVAEDQRAWHAGAGSWCGLEDINSRSIGIELDNRGDEPFPEPQMHSLEMLLVATLDRWSIAPERVIGHSDMAPGRKVDPGPRFDWARLARQGLAAPTPTSEAEPVQDLAKAIRQAGYTADAPIEDLLKAVFLRHGAWSRDPAILIPALARQAGGRTAGD